MSVKLVMEKINAASIKWSTEEFKKKIEEYQTNELKNIGMFNLIFFS
jgi:hypothetical protein